MEQYQLEQIIIISRHGIRTALPETLRFLQTVTPKSWPQWDCKPGYLTTRGGTLESFFGAYFRKWLLQQKFDISPDKVFVYANSLQRTVATAHYFTLGAFPGCDITIHHKYPIERMDPIFNPCVRNASSLFKQQVIHDLKHYTGSSDLIEQLDKKLTPAYELLAEILDYRHSKCYQKYQCEFTKLPTTFDLIINEEPKIRGALAFGTAVVDALTLQYYSGFKHQDNAWGMINSFQHRAMLANIKNQYINLLFKSPILANHIAKPLITFINQMMQQKQHPLVLLVGHDCNIASIMGALGFKDYQLPEQIEETPIGGKLVLQRWRNLQDQQSYFKAEYFYQTIEQLHLASELSLNHPARHITLELNGLQTNGQGLYPWSEFKERIMKYLTGVTFEL